MKEDKIIVRELLDALKHVKQVMDADSYAVDFDDMYNHISEIISKYEDYNISNGLPK